MGNFVRAGVGGLFLFLLDVPTSFAQSADWNRVEATAYLDRRAEWWMAWPKAARDHGTFCISCHTALPYALGRAALDDKSSPSETERTLRDNVRKRVRLWKEVEPFYPDQTRGLPKTSESRGTESILNALVLVWNERSAAGLSAEARLALDNMWALQLKSGEMSGAWAWLQFHNAPWEGDSQFYGAALAAIAVGSAPGNYRNEPAIQPGLKLLRDWLQKNMESQTPADCAVLLWASGTLRGLLTDAQQSAIVDRVLTAQRPDGGFSISTLVGDWKRSDKTPLDPASDGYATGLIAFALEQVNAPRARQPLQRALEWLRKNQLQPEGRWAASSLNKDRAVASEAGLFMSDAATAFAVLALTSQMKSMP